MSTVEIFCTGTARSAHRKFVIETVTEVGGRWFTIVKTQHEPDVPGEPNEVPRYRYPQLAAEDELNEERQLDTWTHLADLAELVEADGRYPLRCGRCPKRNTRVTPDTLGKTLDKIVDAGLDWLDLRHSRF